MEESDEKKQTVGTGLANERTTEYLRKRAEHLEKRAVKAEQKLKSYEAPNQNPEIRTVWKETVKNNEAGEPEPVPEEIVLPEANKASKEGAIPVVVPKLSEEEKNSPPPLPVLPPLPPIAQQEESASEKSVNPQIKEEPLPIQVVNKPELKIAEGNVLERMRKGLGSTWQTLVAPLRPKMEERAGSIQPEDRVSREPEGGWREGKIGVADMLNTMNENKKKEEKR